MRAFLIPAATLALLAGCATEVGVGPNNASFGIADQHNKLIQSAAYRRGEFLMEAQAAFASAVPDRVTFAFDRADLDRGARQALAAQAEWLRDNPAVRVRVTGHTDLVGGEGYNARLGLRRARAVARYFVARGIDRTRIDTVETQGETDPVVATTGRERRNRRAVTRVAGFTFGFVGDGMDGRRARLMYNRYATDGVESPASVGTTGGGG